MSEFNPSVPDKSASSESASTPVEAINAHVAAATQMATNAKDSVINATSTARDAVARHSQATMDDVHGLTASAQQAFHDSNGHPLAKYHSFVYDTLTWKFPRASAIALFVIVSGLLASQFINFSRFVFRILWLSFATTATIELISKLILGRGLVSGLKPRQYYQVNKDTLDAFFAEIANVSNFFVLEFQRLLFAEKTHHTGIAFVICFVAYKLVRYIPLWSLALIGTILAFGIPPLYLHHKELIDKHIANAQNLAAEKVAVARDMAGEKVSFASERARHVTSEWGRKAGIELPWSPPKRPANPTTVKPVGTSTGVESLQELNVPQATPQKRTDPTQVPLPDTPAPVAS